MTHAKKPPWMTTIHALVHWIVIKDILLCVKPCACIITKSTMKLATETARPAMTLVIANMNWIIAIHNAMEIPHVRMNVLVTMSAEQPRLLNEVDMLK